jgi:hypothetical protein
MNPPSVAAYRLLCALLLGIGLGVFYGFLRPLRRRHKHIADFLFILALFPAWIYFAFAIAGGDLRFGYTAGLLGGILLWEATFGKWLRPVFAAFWRFIYKIYRFFTMPFRKIFKILAKIAKFLFATAKKWVIIKWNNRLQKAKRHGGVTHGNEKKLFQPLSSDIPSQLPDAQRSGACYGHTVYGDIADPGRHHP